MPRLKKKKALLVTLTGVVFFLGPAPGGARLDNIYSPLPQQPAYRASLAALGKKLFSDTILSRDRTVSCATCHNLSLFGTDGRATSVGVGGQTGFVNSPTVFNSRYNFRQFWNGRSPTLATQAIEPVLNSREMGMTRREVEERLNDNDDYRELFDREFNRLPVTLEMVGKAIAEFEKALVTPNSRFDRFLRGEVKLNPEEKAGFNHFQKLGCANCHHGINLGGNSFQKLGLLHPYPRHRETPDRMAITGEQADRNVFKVPGLRNIAKTAPYFHDGEIASLEEVVENMAWLNLGRKLSPRVTGRIVAFLQTLTGETPAILESGAHAD